MPPQIAIVLPPKEGFSPDAVGAIGLIIRRLVLAGAPGTVVGAPTLGAPFPDVPFLPAPPGWGWDGTARYAAGVARVLRRRLPALVEVWNRPDLALRLARALPMAKVALFLENDPRAMRRARTGAQRAALLARLAGVVCASAWLRDRFMEGVPQGARLPGPAVLHNAIDPGELAPPVPRERLVLFTGRVVRDKGVDAFVEACAAALPGLPGWRAEIIGADRFRPDSPDTPFLAALRPRSAAAGVTMRGYQPHTEVMAALARASIAVVPSRWQEPFGMAALEAMASGAALICSRNGALPEVAGDAALYTDPDAPGELAAAITRLAADDALRARLSEAGQARAALFGAPQAAEALRALRAAMFSDGAAGTT